MAGKKLCALISVSVLVALGLIVVVLGELPPGPAAEATAPTFVADEGPNAAPPLPVARLENEPVRLESDTQAEARRRPMPELLMDDAALAAPVRPGYGLGLEPIERPR